MKTYGLYSAGGFSREVVGYLHHALNSPDLPPYEIVFIDDNVGTQGQILHECPVISYDDFLALEDRLINITFADTGLRRRKAEQASDDGFQFFSIFAPSFHQGANVTIGEGAIFAHLSTITCDATVGRHFHCNIYSYASHDCIIGDFVTFAPRVSLNGRVVVEDDVYIGSDATILPGKIDKPLIIGKGAVIGAGAVVTRDVAPGSVMVGNPARPMQR